MDAVEARGWTGPFFVLGRTWLGYLDDHNGAVWADNQPRPKAGTCMAEWPGDLFGTVAKWELLGV